MLTDALVYGVPYDLFWHLNPTKLKPFAEAYKIKLNEQDALAYYAGLYNLRAFAVTLDAAFSGKNRSTLKYFEHPIRYSDEDVEDARVANPESHEQVAVYEMKARMKMLEKTGLPPSPK